MAIPTEADQRLLITLASVVAASQKPVPHWGQDNVHRDDDSKERLFQVCHGCHVRFLVLLGVPAASYKWTRKKANASDWSEVSS